MSDPDLSPRLARAKFRAWHRGTREADYIFGGFFDHHHASWDEPALIWFEALLDEDDVDVMAWALRSQTAPERFVGPQMLALQKLDYVTI
ncbi:MAG: succinate dehydrogenase assembly factor 2 [Porphyrobacter sp.]|nr:succinate dehydrogenase assembly factor 2 [Porphyrobacter sp.]